MISEFFFRILRPILFYLDAELTHNLTFSSLKIWGKINYFFRAPTSPPVSNPIIINNLKFKNRIGLAAGLDKNGEYIDILARFGFGAIEIGTVTPRPQKGNEKPRLFRMVNENALLNRMGFNNDGIEAVLKNVMLSLWVKEKKGILGINLGINADTPIKDAFKDYEKGLNSFWKVADYFVINISSPNTKNLRDLQSINHLENLIVKIQFIQTKLTKKFKLNKPIYYKISPDNTDLEMERMSIVFNRLSVDGVILTNTTKNHEVTRNGSRQGGLSGEPLRNQSLSCLLKLSALLDKKITLIASGGIMTSYDALKRLESGANIVQIYTGLVFEGPKIVRESISLTGA